MPLIRRENPQGERGKGASSVASDQDALSLLSQGDPELRRKAARALGNQASATYALGQALSVETSADVREAIFTSLVQIGTDDSARVAASFIRSDVAAVRTAALDALAVMPGPTERLLPGLLADPDADVRLLSCELCRSVPTDVAIRLLGDLLGHERDANVCGAAVEVLAEVGTSEAVAPLLACKARLSHEAFLGFAVDEAVARAGAGRFKPDA